VGTSRGRSFHKTPEKKQVPQSEQVEGKDFFQNYLIKTGFSVGTGGGINIFAKHPTKTGFPVGTSEERNSFADTPKKSTLPSPYK
jgi:hypothetical protein